MKDPGALELDLQQRAGLCQLFGSLTPRQWQQPTLCHAWRVRDIAGHLIVTYEMPVPAFLVRLARHGFASDRAVGQLARDRASGQEPAQLLGALDSLPPRSGLASLLPPAVMLYDHLVHEQDIRRPLGLPRSYPPATLRRVLQVAPAWNGAIGSKRRAQGLRLQATDVAWEHGQGPAVRGPAEAILMALAGRPAALCDLDGPGVEVLKSRTPSPPAPREPGHTI